MSAGKPIHPEVMYAERSSATEPEKNFIYLTFRIDDLNPGYKVDLQADSLTFSGTSGDPAKGLPEKQWACKINFYHEIVPEQTKQMPYTGRDLLLIIRKKELKAEYWPRLTKEPLNRNWIKTDFTRWADEDEQEEAPVEEDDMAGMGGMPGMPGMGGMGGMPGMGGAGGMPGGMDMASLMGGMGGGGAGAGAGGMDFAKLMEQMGGAGGAGGAGGMPDLSALMAQAGAAGAGGEGDDGEEGADADASKADAKADADASK